MGESILILYNPTSTSPSRAPLPMSLLALGAVLEGKYRYEIVDGNLLSNPAQDLQQIIRERKPCALGVTVMPGPQLNQAVPLTKEIKQNFPGLPIIWGGYFPTQHSDVVLESGYVDYVVHGQGELTLLELLDVLRNGGDTSAIKGLSYRDTVKISKNPSRPLCPIEEFPPFPYHQVQMEHYIRENYVGSRTTDHNSSFGCPFGCNFCAIVSISNRRWSPESPKRMAATFELLRHRYGVNAVLFHDMDFFISESRVAEFCDRTKHYGMNWWGLGRVDELYGYKDSTWKLMKQSGLKMLFCGAESGSDEMLRQMDKGGKASTRLTLELALKMKSYGIIPEYSFVLGNPPDPELDVELTTNFIRRLKKVNPATEIILYTYTPVPQNTSGTGLHEHARAAGFKFPTELDEWVGDTWQKFALRREPDTPWCDGNIYRQIRNFERVVNAYYPTTTDMKLTGLRKAILKAFGGWRYHLRFYNYPIELRVLQKVFSYQRPETTGF